MTSHILPATWMPRRTLCGLARDAVATTGWRTAHALPERPYCPDCCRLAGLPVVATEAAPEIPGQLEMWEVA